MQPTSIYIHIPFCIHRCGYCDFNTYAGLQALIPDYTQAVCKEIQLLAELSEEKLFIGTIYFGGGTPSLMAFDNLIKILSTLKEKFWFLDTLEVSLEANPGTVTKDFLFQLHSIGVNRLSFGMQSANLDELMLLERQHKFMDVVNAIDWSREAGFTNINLDLIYGLPYQSVANWMTNLESALTLRPEHLSLYALTIEDGTPLSRQVKMGILPEPDQDEVADMYESARRRLISAGYHQYEISNWAYIDHNEYDFSCKHNLQYWRNLPYLGIGAGAHGYINHHRTINIPTPQAYIGKLLGNPEEFSSIYEFPLTPATIKNDLIDMETEIGETMMMGLRLTAEGVSNRTFQKRFGMNLLERFGGEINHLIGVGLLEWAGDDGEILRLTTKGYLLGNQVFMEFI